MKKIKRAQALKPDVTLTTHARVYQEDLDSLVALAYDSHLNSPAMLIRQLMEWVEYGRGARWVEFSEYLSDKEKRLKEAASKKGELIQVDFDARFNIVSIKK